MGCTLRVLAFSLKTAKPESRCAGSPSHTLRGMRKRGSSRSKSPRPGSGKGINATFSPRRDLQLSGPVPPRPFADFDLQVGGVLTVREVSAPR
jgi:hypothetical protein